MQTPDPRKGHGRAGRECVVSLRAARDPWDAINGLRAERWALSECVAAFFPERWHLAEELDAMEDEQAADFRTQPPDRADRASARAHRKRAIIRELGGHTSGGGGR